MKRLVLAAATALALATLGASASDSTAAGRPLARVVGEFTAERMGFESPTSDQLVRFGTVTMAVNAFDRTLEPAPCSTCPGLDTGTVTVTSGGGTETLHVADLYITGDTAWMSVVEGFVLVFHDGGTPGSEIVGPENAAGLFPTKDWYEQAFFIGTQHFTGFVTTGNIKVFSLPA